VNDRIHPAGEFGALVAEAQQKLADGAARAGLTRDPNQHLVTAYSEALGVLPAFIQEIADARKPWSNDERREVVTAAVLQMRASVDHLVGESMRWRILMMAAAAVAMLGVGIGIGWWVFGTPSGYTCEVQRGGYVCYAWLKPATQPATPPPASSVH
jgi:anti-sigma-K factor RskA